MGYGCAILRKETSGCVGPVRSYQYINTRSHPPFTYHYDSLGRRERLDYPNGTFADYSFDGLNRLTGITHKMTGSSTLAAYSYPEHDAVGNRKSAVRNGTALTHLYDELYRIYQSGSGNVKEEFLYDSVGNRTVGPGAKDDGYQHDGNRMTKGRKLIYGYDNAGNQTTRTVPNGLDKSWKQTWDKENRLIKVEKAKGSESRTVSFKYDPFGRRIEKKVESVKNGVTTANTSIYLYDGNNIALEIYTDSTGTEETFYTQGAGVDEHLALERDGQFYHYHADGLGSTGAITDSSRGIVQTYEYDSFGMAQPATGFRNGYTYTGREWDKETGLYYYRARYYDPMEGRFISKDPIGFNAGDVNLYGYVHNNPTNFIDPLGLWQVEVMGIKFPLINNFIEPSNEPPSAAETALAFSPIGSVGKVLRFGKTVVSADKFHKVIKPNVLKKAGNFCKSVGNNPNIDVVDGKIWLTGTGPFKGKTFKTILDAIDFFD